jgi:hypothetical protein
MTTEKYSSWSRSEPITTDKGWSGVITIRTNHGWSEPILIANRTFSITMIFQIVDQSWLVLIVIRNSWYPSNHKIFKIARLIVYFPTYIHIDNCLLRKNSLLRKNLEVEPGSGAWKWSLEVEPVWGRRPKGWADELSVKLRFRIWLPVSPVVFPVDGFCDPAHRFSDDTPLPSEGA